MSAVECRGDEAAIFQDLICIACSKRKAVRTGTIQDRDHVTGCPMCGLVRASLRPARTLEIVSASVSIAQTDVRE